jgi:uncharacterized damage-inducible protein DinB
MKLLLTLLLAATLAPAQPKVDSIEGLWQGFDGEWSHVSRLLLALAEAIPAEKYSWSPAPNVRSTSEVLLHTASANYSLLSLTGPPVPKDFNSRAAMTKPEVIAWLRQSLDAVKAAREKLQPADLNRKVKVANREATVDGIYLRILVHANEHLGQLIAYARVNGIAPPW